MIVTTVDEPAGATITGMSLRSRKQLNIRSDEAYATAHELAERVGATATEIVVSALREYKSKLHIPCRPIMPEQAEANYRVIMGGVAAARRRSPPIVSWDAGRLYDKHGAPK